MRTSALFVCLTLAAMASPAAAGAPAALASHVEGQVTIHDATGAYMAETGSLIAPLSRVLVAPDATANLMIDGCAVVLQGAAAYTVPALAPCAPGESLVIRNNINITPTADLDVMQGSDDGSVPPPPPPVYVPAAGAAPTAAVVGVTAAVGLAGAAALAYSVLSDEEAPASPN